MTCAKNHKNWWMCVKTIDGQTLDIFETYCIIAYSCEIFMILFNNTDLELELENVNNKRNIHEFIWRWTRKKLVTILYVSRSPITLLKILCYMNTRLCWIIIQALCLILTTQACVVTQGDVFHNKIHKLVLQEPQGLCCFYTRLTCSCSMSLWDYA